MQDTPADTRGQLTALAGLAGNRATGQLIGRLKKQDALPQHAGLDVAPLLAAQVPELLPLIPADQIEALQRDYDNDASNKELDRRHEARRADLAAGRVPGALMDSDANDDLPGAVHGKYKPVQGPFSFELRTEDVLSDDILQQPSKNVALEMAFRRWLHDELLRHPTVHVSIDLAYVAAYKNNGQTGTTNEAVIHWGSRALPHTKGKVHFKDLVENTYAKEYHDRVTDAPELLAIRRQIAEILGGIDELKGEHEERIRLNGEHPVVRRVAEFLGGGNDIITQTTFLIDVMEHPEKGTFEERQDELSTQCPDLDIWSEPKIMARGAMDIIKADDFEIGLLAYMRAEVAFERAAKRYQRYEDRVMKGAGIAVKWLERAKFAGKLAASAIPGGGVLDAAMMAAMYTLAQEGGQQAAEVAQGQRSAIDFAGLAKQATMDGAMAFFGGLTQGAFTRALEARIAAAEGAAAVGYAGNKLIVGTTAAAATAVYNIPANIVLQKIIYGKAHLPASADELAKMVLDEASTAVLTDAGMQGVHHAFGEGHGGARPEDESRGGTPEPKAREGEPSSAGATPPAGAAPEAAATASTAQRKLELVELAESAASSPSGAEKLLDHFGSWERAVGSLQQGRGDLAALTPEGRAEAVSSLVDRRAEVGKEVSKFGAEPADQGAAGDPAQAAELRVKGQDAGLKVAQASEHLDAAHPGWQERFRMRVEMDGAARAKTISESLASLPKAQRDALTSYRAEAEGMLSAWREARGATTPELREAILGRIHGPEFHAWAKQMIDISPADAAAQRIEHLVDSDRAFQKLDPTASPDVRYAQLKEAIDHQLLAAALEPELLPMSGPAADIADSPGSTPKQGKQHTGGDKARDLMRPGTAAERLEARRIVETLEQLGPVWANTPIPERLDALTRIANMALRARGVPNVDVVMAAGAPGTGGHFAYRIWKIAVDPTYVKGPTLEPELVQYMSGLGRHESDHAIQWWEMARMRAAEGDDAATIHAKMEIDLDVAVQAVEVVKRGDRPSAEELARARQVYDSWYGSGPGSSKDVNDRRAKFSKEIDQFDASIEKLRKQGATFDASVWQGRRDLYDSFIAADRLYKALPEENRSYTADGIVKAEASLMEAEREFEFAEIAMGHAEEVMRGVEDQMRRALDRGEMPSAELEADRAHLEEQLQKLDKELEKARTKRRMLEGYVRGGEGEGP